MQVFARVPKAAAPLKAPIGVSVLDDDLDAGARLACSDTPWSMVRSSTIGEVTRASRSIGLLCRERQADPDHGCHQWHWVGGGRGARRTRREPRHRRSQQDQDAHCIGSHQGGGEGGDGGDIHRRPLVAGLGAQTGRRGGVPLSKAGCARQQRRRMYGTRQLTKDGIELTWAVNHLAPFLLSKLLLRRLKESAPARIITTASQAHRGARIPFDDLNAERSYPGFGRYCETKLANILFTTELARRLDGTGVTANCFHPGLVATGFNRSNGLLMKLGMTILRPVSRSPEKGAEPLVWLATSPDVANVSGVYFFDQEQGSPSPEAQDTETARRLWEISERQCTVSGRSAEARS